jgi:arsenite methyltransferase
MEDQQTFFDFAAEVGLTKHIGGIEATEALIQQCHIDERKYILDVGCGVGVTPSYIAKKYGTRIMGVDIIEKMIERSTERARKLGVADRVEFKVADAQDLPFNDGLFDAVIAESVIALVGDQQGAINEFVRVTKPGGYVGLNESLWLKTPPPPDVVAWASQDIGSNVRPQTLDTWRGLLESAGLQDIATRTFEIKIQDEAKGILQRYGLGGMLRIYWRILFLYIRNPAYRKFVSEVQASGIIPVNLDEYFGYGLFVGQKHERPSQE